MDLEGFGPVERFSGEHVRSSCIVRIGTIEDGSVLGSRGQAGLSSKDRHALLEDFLTCLGGSPWPKGQPPRGLLGHQDLGLSSAGSCWVVATGIFMLPYL